MPPTPTPESLPEVLRFRPWPPGDPALSVLLELVREQVDQPTRMQLLRTHLELHQEVLQAHAKAIDKALAILPKSAPPPGR